MNKITITLLLFCVLSVSGFAQHGKHDITIGFGVGSTNRNLPPYSDLIPTNLPEGYYKNNNKGTGVFSLGYKYHVSDRIAVGGLFLYEHIGADTFLNSDQTGTTKLMCKTIALEMEVVYFSSRNIAVYGVAGAGYTNQTQKTRLYTGNYVQEGDNFINFQLSPIGIRFGRQAGLYIEGGYGYKGIANTGLFMSF